jgi:hypothetical protein
LNPKETDVTIKRAILYVLLALGLTMIGSGVWLLHSATQNKVNIPEGNPVIYEKLDYIMRGEFTYLYIYEDGSIIYIEEKGLRISMRENPPTRIWKTGKLTNEQLDCLLEYFKNSGLEGLDGNYQFPGKPIEGGPSGGLTTGDMGFTLIVDSRNISKTVTAYGYLTTDHGQTYPDMPSPLNEIYCRLRVLALTTENVYQESISQ